MKIIKNNNVFPKVLPYKKKIKAILLFLGVTIFQFANAQLNVQFDAFPKGSQLYQRDDFNKAIVSVKGKVFTEGYSDISVLVLRNKKNFSYQKQKLNYQFQNPKYAPFAFEPKINAELNAYTFYVYLFNGKDSILIKEENNIISGDVILIYGQSNALAIDSLEITRFEGENDFGRTSFMIPNANDWLHTQKWNFWSAGLIGLEVQKQLIDKYKIPIAIINGAIGNKSITELMERDEVTHDNPSFYYGKLLKKAKDLEFAKSVRAIIWRQGESEALNSAYKNDYGKNFEKFRKQLLEDYPSLKKIYTFQNNIYFSNNDNAGNLREYQRNIKEIFPDCEALATFGTAGFNDGLHYKLEGYQETGEQVSRLIARDFMQSNDTLQIYSPQIKKIYLTSKKDSLILEFDKNQKMVYPQPIVSTPKKPTLDLKDYIYLDGKAGNIASGSNFENLIILKLKEPQKVQKITYATDFYTLAMAQFLPEAIPPIKNSRGLNAFTFKDFAVTELSEVPKVTPEINTLTGKWDLTFSKRIVLNWVIPQSLNTTFIIEKSINNSNNFVKIDSTKTSLFYDYKVKFGVKYYYRLKMVENGRIYYSNSIEINPSFSNANLVLVDADNILIYPNPIQSGTDLNIEILSDDSYKRFRLISLNGKIIKQMDEFETQNQYAIKTDKLSAGLYIIEVILNDNTKLTKKFVVE